MAIEVSDMDGNMNQDSPRKPRRHLLVNASWVAALSTVFLAGYIASAGVVSWCKGKGIVSESSPDVIRIVYAPVEWYCEKDLPGRRTLIQFCMWCYLRGAGGDGSWDDVGSAVDDFIANTR